MMMTINNIYVLFRLIVFSRSSFTRLKDSVSCICNRQGNASNTGTAPKASANLMMMMMMYDNDVDDKNDDDDNDDVDDNDTHIMFVTY